MNVTMEDAGFGHSFKIHEVICHIGNTLGRGLLDEAQEETREGVPYKHCQWLAPLK